MRLTKERCRPAWSPSQRALERFLNIVKNPQGRGETGEDFYKEQKSTRPTLTYTKPPTHGPSSCDFPSCEHVFSHLVLSGELLLVFEVQHQDRGLCTKVAAGMQDANQWYHAIYDEKKRATIQTSPACFLKRIDRRNSAKYHNRFHLQQAWVKLQPALCPLLLKILHSTVSHLLSLL